MIALATCVIFCIILALADGFLSFDRGPNQLASHIWVSDFRFVFEQCMVTAGIIWVGSKFIENRTIFTVGFDKLDATKMVVKGPDSENVVWIGRTYAVKAEAEAVAAALEVRLRESRED
jgi:hypothetical protein